MTNAILVLGLVLAAGGAMAQETTEPADLVPDEWHLLETKTVESVRDRESALSTTMGEDVAWLAFLAVDGDLQCDRISAGFADGGTDWLAMEPGTLLKEGTLHPVELRDGFAQSEVIRINYTCSPVAGTQVTMNIYGAD